MNHRERTDFIVVHCSKTKPDQLDDKKRPYDARSLDRKHRLQGKLKIGYHYVIERTGVAIRGRPADECGSHARGYNDRSVGICLVGGSELSKDVVCEHGNFTAEQLSTLRSLLDDLAQQFPDAAICGHRDLEGHDRNSCPSFDVTEFLNTKE